jgi:hypothetical protein
MIQDERSPSPIFPYTPTFIAGAQISSEEEDDRYNLIPRSKIAKLANSRIEAVKQWHQDLQQPSDLLDKQYATFIRYATEFFPDSDRLWRKDSQGAHKLVVKPDRRLYILRHVHDNIGHRRFYATHATLLQRFWWPHMQDDLVWFVRSCHICQVVVTLTFASLYSCLYVMSIASTGTFIRAGLLIG